MAAQNKVRKKVFLSVLLKYSFVDCNVLIKFISSLFSVITKTITVQETYVDGKKVDSTKNVDVDVDNVN